MTTILLAIYFSMNLAIITDAAVEDFIIGKYVRNIRTFIISILSYVVVLFVGLPLIITCDFGRFNND